MTVGLADRIESDRFIDITDSFRSFFDLEVGFTEQVVGVGGSWLNVDRCCEWFDRAFIVLFQTAQTAKIHLPKKERGPFRHALDVRAFAFVILLGEEVGGAKFGPCQEIMRVGFDELFQCDNGIFVAFLIARFFCFDEQLLVVLRALVVISRRYRRGFSRRADRTHGKPDVLTNSFLWWTRQDLHSSTRHFLLVQKNDELILPRSQVHKLVTASVRNILTGGCRSTKVVEEYFISRRGRTHRFGLIHYQVTKEDVIATTH